MAGLLELLASMFMQTHEPGSTFCARVGAIMVAGQVDEDGVVIGYNKDGGNPVMLRTAMDRLMCRSQHGDERVSATSGFDAAAPSGSPEQKAEVAGFTDATSSSKVPTPGASYLDELSFEISETLRTSGRSKAHFESSRHSQPHFEVAQQSQAQQSQAQQSQAQQSQAQQIGFEIVFSDSEAPPAQLTPEAAVEECTWDDVASHVEGLIEDCCTFVGRIVAVNYWRESIRESEVVLEHLRVDAHGRLEVRDPASPVDASHASALDDVQRRCVERCSRVIPDVHTSLPKLDHKPWANAHSSGARR